MTSSTRFPICMESTHSGSAARCEGIWYIRRRFVQGEDESGSKVAEFPKTPLPSKTSWLAHLATPHFLLEIPLETSHSGYILAFCKMTGALPRKSPSTWGCGTSSRLFRLRPTICLETSILLSDLS